MITHIGSLIPKLYKAKESILTQGDKNMRDGKYKTKKVDWDE